MEKPTLKELQARIDELEAEQDNLEAEIAVLEQQLAGYDDNTCAAETLNQLETVLCRLTRDIGPTVLGPLNTVEKVLEALDHGFITLIRV